MHVSGTQVGSGQFSQSGLNTGVLDTLSSVFNVSPFSAFVLSVIEASGTITGSVITVQVSVNNTDWYDSAVTVAGELISSTFSNVTRYMRLKVTTASAIASTANILIRGR